MVGTEDGGAKTVLLNIKVTKRNIEIYKNLEIKIPLTVEIGYKEPSGDPMSSFRHGELHKGEDGKQKEMKT